MEVLHVDLARFVTTFFNNFVNYARLFSAGLVSCSWCHVRSIGTWQPNDTFLSLCREIQDWCRRVIALPKQCFPKTGTSVGEADFVAPLVSSKNIFTLPQKKVLIILLICFSNLFTWRGALSVSVYIHRRKYEKLNCPEYFVNTVVWTFRVSACEFFWWHNQFCKRNQRTALQI